MRSYVPLAVTPRYHKQLLLARNPVRFCDELRSEFGDFVRARGIYDFYLVNHPDLVAAILVDKDGAVGRAGSLNPMYERIGNIGRTGLATSAPQHWKQQRRRIAPLFTASAIRGFGETMIATAMRWAERWDATSRTGASFNIKDETNELSLDVNTRCLFGAELGDDHGRLQGWFSVMKEYLETFPYPVVGQWWFPSPINLRTKLALRGFDRYAMDLVGRRRQAARDPNAKDMVARMIDARDAETGRGMTAEQICHEMLTFLIAGFESTSSALLWLFYHLAQNPEIEARMHAELDRVLGGRRPALEDLAALSYTKRVIDEVMRKSPSSWFVSRTTTEAREFGGTRLAPGSHFLVSIPTLHNHPGLWPNPDRFDPDRFLPDAVARRSPNTYVPFGRGAHACVGVHFSLQELLIMAAVLCSRFRVVMAQSRFDPQDVRAGVSVYPRHGIRMRVVRRQHSSDAARTAEPA